MGEKDIKEKVVLFFLPLFSSGPVDTKSFNEMKFEYTINKQIKKKHSSRARMRSRHVHHMTDGDGYTCDKSFYFYFFLKRNNKKK